MHRQPARPATLRKGLAPTRLTRPAVTAAPGPPHGGDRVSTSPEQEAVHDKPTWRGLSDFIIAARIEEGGELTVEQLWARRLDEYEFEICCIPFFIYDLALGDVVETDSDYTVKRLVRPSGHFTFRVWLGDSSWPKADIVRELEELGARLEWASLNLLAVDGPNDPVAQKIADYLQEHEVHGHLVYETGRTR